MSQWGGCLRRIKSCLQRLLEDEIDEEAVGLFEGRDKVRGVVLSGVLRSWNEVGMWSCASVGSTPWGGRVRIESRGGGGTEGMRDDSNPAHDPVS